MKVTIITATYNSDRNLQQCIDSVRLQDYKNIEHIIVDGQSSDRTLEIIQANKHNIGKFISEKDTGIYNAFNKGLKLATGDIIGFLNSDDILADAQVISKIVYAFHIEKTDVVYGNLLYKTNKDTHYEIVRYWKSNPFNFNSLKYGWMPPHPTLYCKKEVYREVGSFDEHYKIASDYDYMLRIFKNKNFQKLYLPVTLVKMTIGGVSNRSFKNIIWKSSEDLKVVRQNNIGGYWTVILKNIRKVKQFNRFRIKEQLC